MNYYQALSYVYHNPDKFVYTVSYMMPNIGTQYSFHETKLEAEKAICDYKLNNIFPEDSSFNIELWHDKDFKAESFRYKNGNLTTGSECFYCYYNGHNVLLQDKLDWLKNIGVNVNSLYHREIVWNNMERTPDRKLKFQDMLFDTWLYVTQWCIQQNDSIIHKAMQDYII